MERSESTVVVCSRDIASMVLKTPASVPADSRGVGGGSSAFPLLHFIPSDVNSWDTGHSLVTGHSWDSGYAWDTGYSWDTGHSLENYLLREISPPCSSVTILREGGVWKTPATPCLYFLKARHPSFLGHVPIPADQFLGSVYLVLVFEPLVAIRASYGVSSLPWVFPYL